MMVEMLDREEPRDGVERAVAAHLRSELEPQRGRAADAFRAAVAAGLARRGPESPADDAIAGNLEQARQEQERQQHDQRKIRRTVWLWGGIPTALAACVALAVGLQVFLGQPGTSVRIGSGGGPSVHAAPAAMEENVWTRDVDGGLVMGDQGPLKVLKQQTVRERRWVDPDDGAVYSVTEPGEKVGYVRIKPF